MPGVDQTPDVALLRVLPVDVRRAASLSETMPANCTPVGVLVVAVLGNAPLTLEARSLRIQKFG